MFAFVTTDLIIQVCLLSKNLCYDPAYKESRV